jgi:GT2 family glycosyltransferase
VTIVVVNWNKKDDALRLLDSIEAVEYENYEVVVVDNASTDDSSESVLRHPVVDRLIQNQENLGGTGGFNTGLCFAMEERKQEYIWLLDNDAITTPSSLKFLVETLEQDLSIGLAGSKIINRERPDYIVETGANILWSKGNVAPVNQNCKDSQCTYTNFDVDYVAICSALVRDSALRQVGCMDQRYFLLWDDMDWGYTFKRHGYRVVAVGSSLVRHAAFTEKRSIFVDYYFGIRNPMLALGKHAKGLTLLRGLGIILRRALYFHYACRFSGRDTNANLPICAINDFLNDRWGKPILGSGVEPTAQSVEVQQNFCGKNVLVLPLGSVESVQRLVCYLRSGYGDFVNITLAVPEERMKLFAELPVDRTITFKNTFLGNVLASMKIFINGLGGRYFCAILSDAEKVSPLTYSVGRVFLFDEQGEALLRIKEGFWQIWRVAATVISAEISLLYYLSRAYRKCRQLSYTVSRVEK